MTTLVFQTKHISGKKVGALSCYPAMREPIKSTIDSRLSEDDGLFINYGMFSDSLPYRMFDDYDLNEFEELELASAVLENQHLRAEFVLSLGGRLWSLYDKDENRELLTANEQFIPCNLAIRNAWFAGGIEYNCGRRGHDVNTCCDRFAAQLDDPEYGPVLRIYDYSIDRKVPYQMDFFLPGDSRMLFMRGRISNHHKSVIPMYFWSNMALPMTPGCRVVVPADSTYVNKYDNGSHFITRIAMPDGEGFDQTYPENFPLVRDHFYNIPENTRKYEALFNADGSGFIHLSTRRLQGRKLFVWGDTVGGNHWQRKLLAPGMCNYLELQAGLAKTQQESLPMPPESAWEWLEAYGSIQGDPEKIFSSWDTARNYTNNAVDEIMPEAFMDQMLADTKERIALKSGVLKHRGSPDAALEEMRRGSKLSNHLDFAEPYGDAEEWIYLLQHGKFNEKAPSSFTVDPDWQNLIEQAPDCWKKFYHQSLRLYRNKDYTSAIKAIEKALSITRNTWTLQAAGNIYLAAGINVEAGLKMLAECVVSPEADAYLIKESLKVLNLQKAYDSVLDCYKKLSERDQSRPMVQLQYAIALARSNRQQEALAVLMQNGGLELPDAREGEVMISALFMELAGENTPMPFVLNYITK